MEHLKNYWWIYAIIVIAIVLIIKKQNPISNLLKTNGSACSKVFFGYPPSGTNMENAPPGNYTLYGTWKNGECIINANNYLVA